MPGIDPKARAFLRFWNYQTPLDLPERRLRHRRRRRARSGRPLRRGRLHRRLGALAAGPRRRHADHRQRLLCRPARRVAATGIGEHIVRHLLARTVYGWIEDGMPLEQALKRGVGLFDKDVDGRPDRRQPQRSRFLQQSRHATGKDHQGMTTQDQAIHDKAAQLVQGFGNLVIIGGHEDRKHDMEILKRFVELAGGADARIVVITAASTVAERDVGDLRQGLRRARRAQRVHLHLRSRQDANNEEHIRDVAMPPASS
jgi:hypothetical protein